MHKLRKRHLHACEKFNEYVSGKKFHIQTDHKPLLPLLTTKNLEELPGRIQRFRMRLMMYQYTIEHVPGKKLVVADTLSRAPVSATTEEDITFSQQVYAHIAQVLQSLPATDDRITEVKARQEKDSNLQLVRRYLVQGWPNKMSAITITSLSTGGYRVDGGRWNPTSWK